MEYSTTVIIDLPHARVLELFDSKENMYKWQKGLQEMQHLSGIEGQEGAKTKLFYKMGRREIEMIETITKKDLAGEFNATYEAKGVLNIQKNKFSPRGDSKTEWLSVSEFQFSGLMRFIYPLMKGVFKKQSHSFMVDFKQFAESEAEANRF